MELTKATCKSITKASRPDYRAESRAAKSQILDAMCAVTGHNRDYARRALAPRVVKPRAARAPRYDAGVVAALEKCWAVANAPAGKRLAPLLRGYRPIWTTASCGCRTANPADSGHEKLPGDGHEAARWRT